MTLISFAQLPTEATVLYLFTPIPGAIRPARNQSPQGVVTSWTRCCLSALQKSCSTV